MEFTTELAGFLRTVGLKELKAEHATTMQLLDCCPEDKLGWRIHEKCMPFGEHFHHQYSAGIYLFNVAAGKETKGEKPAVPTTKKELREACEKLYEQTVQLWKSLSPRDLATQRDFMGMGNHAAVEFLRWHISHLVHHRGQLQMYLRVMGASCPSIYGPTADVTFEKLMASKAPAAATV
jgi:uncharacterized damage-inducible protein DinB